MNEWLVLVHVATAFWLVAGFLGRNLTIARARGSEDVRGASELMELAGRFERLLVMPGSIAVPVAGLVTAWVNDVPFTGSGNWWLLTSLVLFVSTGLLVPTVFLPRGRVFEHAMTEAKARGVVTPELRAAFRDPAVRNARWLELTAVAVVLTLMVTKPF